MGKSSRRVRTRSRTVAKLVPVLCERPFPDDWKSPDTSRNADAVSANLFKVLSAIKQTPVLSIFRVSLSLSLSLSRSLSLSLSPLLQVCAVSWFAWKWRMALASQPDLQMWWFWKKKKTVWTVSLGFLSAAKFRPSSDTSGALPLCHWWLVRVASPVAAATNWPWVRRLFRRRFIHHGNWSWQGLRSFSVSPRTTTNHSNHCNFVERAKLFPAKKACCRGKS